jgi:hypothetical protein
MVYIITTTLAWCSYSPPHPLSPLSEWSGDGGMAYIIRTTLAWYSYSLPHPFSPLSLSGGVMEEWFT